MQKYRQVCGHAGLQVGRFAGRQAGRHAGRHVVRKEGRLHSQISGGQCSVDCTVGTRQSETFLVLSQFLMKMTI